MEKLNKIKEFVLEKKELNKYTYAEKNLFSEGFNFAITLVLEEIERLEKED